MPFNSGGIYTPTSGATTAAPGDIIKSAIWNAIFTDISSALTLLGQQLYGATAVTAAHVVGASDTFLQITSAISLSITLPAAASRSGYPVAVKDVAGDASPTVVYTITPNGAETIDGLSSITITAPYGGYNLYPISGGWTIHP